MKKVNTIDKRINPNKVNFKNTEMNRKNRNQYIDRDDIEFNRKNKVNDKKRKKKKRKKIIIIILIIIMFMIIQFGISVIKWNSLMKDIMICENSVVLDSTGDVIAKLGESRIQQNVKLENVPQNLINAYISIEDKNFYKHKGVNVKRTVAATATYIFNGGKSSFGGSTITQQLVKNVTGENENKISRKVEEWNRAFKTELVMSKDEILELYFNIIYVGPNVYGVEKGAEYYFNKNVSDLDLAECAFLAGINHSPNSYNPFRENTDTDKIKNRCKTVLKVMLEENYITEEDYNSAVEEVENGLKFNNKVLEANGNAIYSYMADATINEAIKDFSKKKKISTSFATNYFYFSGAKIYSTQNSDIQKNIEDEMKKARYQVKSTLNKDTHLQGAMIVIDHSNGQVKGCVGGLGEKTSSRGFNRATQGLRQTGSAIKPIAVLGPALEENILTPLTVYDDTLTTFENNYTPKDCEKELGNITVRRAVESSQNIPFVKMMEQLTSNKSMKYMEKEGISTLMPGDNNLGLALGGLEKGITPLEMAGAYASIANGGKYIEPIFYTKIENHKGNIILKRKQKTNKVYSEDTTYVLKKLLVQPVIGENGTAKMCKIEGKEVAAKTGTTNDDYDKWLCGFTNYYTAVTWIGFDVNESINEGANSMANQIWANVMNEIHRNLIDVNFKDCSSVQRVEICKDTNKIACENCKNKYIEYFRKNQHLPERCDKHT